MKLLRRSLSATLGGDLVTVATVDSFQGQEYDVVVVSAVRGSAGGAGGAGFLADRPRLNVLLTRARMGLVIIGHAPTLARSPGWGRLLISLKERSLATGSGLEAVPLSARNSCSAEGYFGAKVPPSGDGSDEKNFRRNPVCSYARQSVDGAIEYRRH